MLKAPGSIYGDWSEGAAGYLKGARGQYRHFSPRTEEVVGFVGNAVPLTLQDPDVGLAPAPVSAVARRDDGQSVGAERGGAGESEPFPQPLPVRDQLRVQ